ncbi:YkuS family protein [Crassaminicella profunda]|uniref:YkuS family protein n=1 Tax=Crassaminicella profunda TaxID=1286698 RepID=UPI001CA75563|nr:YkuS family protein [Crassaminicella profunda]QZY57320.1 YkuS family protein [Crassaminicella profunda]
MKRKVVGVQRELNEIAEELIRQGIKVTDLLETNEHVDAMVYYDDESDMINEEGFENVIHKKQVVKINAAKNNIDQIVRKIKEI